jgi:hypothetical protein
LINIEKPIHVSTTAVDGKQPKRPKPPNHPRQKQKELQKLPPTTILTVRTESRSLTVDIPDRRASKHGEHFISSRVAFHSVWNSTVDHSTVPYRIVLDLLVTHLTIEKSPSSNSIARNRINLQSSARNRIKQSEVPQLQ